MTNPPEELDLSYLNISAFANRGGVSGLAMLASEKAREQQSGRVQLERRKALWLQAIAELYGRIESNWLAPLLDAGSIELRRGEIEINEELLGRYIAPNLELLVGGSSARLQPRGTFVVGAFGRVDLTGPRGVELLVLCRIEEPGAEASPETPWQLAFRNPQAPRRWLDADVFADALSSVLAN